MLRYIPIDTLADFHNFLFNFLQEEVKVSQEIYAALHAH